MTGDATLVFVLGSGRSGTKMAAKLFAGVDHVEAHHEYVRDAYQREGALYAMGRLQKSAMAERLTDIYGAAAHYSWGRYFLDSSNKLAWVTDVLVDAFPDARFIHLVRDGRKVASSFFHKLGGHVYADWGLRALRSWLEHPDLHPMPPPPEEFWWPIPQEGQPFHDRFPSFDHFQRCCYHWTQANRTILDGLQGVPDNRKLMVRLEDLTSSSAEAERFLSFLDVPFDNSFVELLRRPQHVYVPLDFPLTPRQRAEFAEIGGALMGRLGYQLDAEEYSVNY